MAKRLLRPRNLLIALAAIVVAVLLWRLALRGDEAPALVTAPVVVGDVERTVLATGTLEPSELVSVGAQVSGQVVRLAVELGDRVQRGDLIAEIDSAPQRNALRNAEASLAAARADQASLRAELAQARLAFERQRQMLAEDATSRAEYEAAEAQAKTLEARIAASEAQIAQSQIAADTARINLGYTRITAPMDGTVVAIVTQEGQTVNANQAAPTIVRLAQLETMTIKAEISEADVTRVEPGQPAWFTILGEPERRREAVLRSIEPAPQSFAQEGSSGSASTSGTAVYYNGLFDVENSEGRLRTGMTAQVQILLDRVEGVPTVPSSALSGPGRDGSYTVQVRAEDGTLEERRVRVALDDGSTSAVPAGLRPGEQVVIGRAGAGEEAATRAPRGRRGPFGT